MSQRGGIERLSYYWELLDMENLLIYGRWGASWGRWQLVSQFFQVRPHCSFKLWYRNWIFAGESEIDQLYIIQRIVGALTPEQLSMFMQNPRY